MNIIEKNANKENIRLEKWYAETLQKLPISEEITVKKDIPYIDDGNERHTFDVYYKTDNVGKRKMPIIFEFHGGGFISGNKKYNTWFGESMAKLGYIVCIMAYPLAFEKNLCEVLKDCYEGMKVAYKVLETMGADTEKIYICGDSAGGFLATYLAAINADMDIAKSIGVTPENMNIKAIGAISALFYCSKIDKNAIFLIRKTLFGKNYKTLSFWKYINPQNQVYKSLPPVYAVTSKGDFLKSYTFNFVDFLRNKGKKAEICFYDSKDLEHDFVCLNPEYQETKDAILKMDKFFKEVK